MIRFGLIALTALVLASASASAEAPATPAAVPANGERAPAAAGANEKLGQSYVLMAKGELAWKSGDSPLAATLYGDALDLLENLENDYPGWATHIVRSRILSCESALEKIREGKPFERETGNEATTNAPASMTFALSASASGTAIKALKAGLEEREAALADLRAEMVALKKENQALKERLAGLDSKTAGAQAIPGVLKSQARQWVAAGAYSNAVSLLVEMRALYPDDPGVHHLTGITLCRMGAFEDALREVEPLVRKGRASADIWMTLGVAYLGTGNIGKARQSFEEALEIDPNLPDAHFNLAQVLIRMKKPEADLARRHYMTAVQLGNSRDADLETSINQALINEQARKLRH